MKRVLCGLAIVVAAFSGQLAEASCVDFNFAALDGAQVKFPGDGTFFFTPTAENNFTVSSACADLPTLVGSQGQLGGTFNIGTVTTVGGLQFASVTGTGTFKIQDSAGKWLTATNVQWVDISTFGSTGGINAQGVVNLKFSSYDGVDASFTKLLHSTDDVATISFQFIPGKTLTWLKTHVSAPDQDHTSFNGTFSAVPAPSSLVSFASLGLLGVLVALRRRKIAA